LHNRLIKVIRAQLVQGISQSDCAQAIALAITIGLFPIVGFSTLIITAIAYFRRLNQPIAQAFNWICGPIKLALIIPFIRVGEFLFGADRFVLNLRELSRQFYENSWATLSEFAWTFVHAIVGWVIFTPIVYLVVYTISKSVIFRMRRGDTHKTGNL
jgi:uncharacterized protein (DUF2062 family)